MVFKPNRLLTNELKTMKITSIETKRFNEIRMEFAGKWFKKPEIQRIIEQVIPANNNYFPRLIELGIIERQKSGKGFIYKFTITPIHQEKLISYEKSIRNYNKSKNNKNFESKIEEAIELLKENGFRIYKKVENYEEI